MVARTAGGIQVLHVDDEHDFATMAAEFLQRQDERLTVETTTSAGRALERLRENAIDCVVSDYDMPGEDGIEFLETVREAYPDLPFILFTGKGSEEIASEAISAGVTDYLQKETSPDQFTVLANRIENVVKQYHAEGRAEKMTRRLEAILENTTTPMFMKDADGAYLLVNRGFRDLFDLHDAEVVGLTDAELFPSDIADEVQPNDEMVLERGVSVELEERVPVDGDERVFLSSKVPIYDIGTDSSPDRPVAVFGVSRDITELKARERELQRSRELLEYTEQLAGTGGWEADVETGEQRWTDGTYSIHDIPPESDFDPTVDAGVGFYHPDDRAVIERAVERCMEGESYEVELRLVTAEGELRWVRATGDAIREEGDIVTIRGAIQDITELAEREQRLARQNERLDALMSIVGQDLGHALATAEGRLAAAREAGESEALEAVARAHDSIGAMLEALLELASSGEAGPGVGTVPVRDVVEACLRELEAGEGLSVTCADFAVRADSGQLRLVVGHLLRSAVDHGGPNVAVEVGDLPGGFYLEDDGPGIPEDERGTLFDSGGATKPGGRGVGHRLVEEVADAHGWSIHVTESQDGGARFEVTGLAPTGG